MNTRRWTAGIGALAALSLIGVGVGSSFSDGATATVTQKVGTFGCVVSSADPHASPVHGHSITITAPTILAQSAGSYPTNVTVTNSGQIPIDVTWAITSGGMVGNGRMSLLTPSPSMGVDAMLAQGASQAYTNVGFTWTGLANADLGQSASVTYTATCKEQSTHVSQVSFVGATNGTPAGNTALALPAGTQPGDMAIVIGGGYTPTLPNGYTAVTGPPGVSMSYRVLAASDTVVPVNGAQSELVAVYRGVAAIGTNVASTAANGNPFGGNTTSLTCPALSLSKPDGTSWVACVAFSTGAPPGGMSMGFPGTTVRTGTLPGLSTGVSDTNKGVTAWTASLWPNDGASGPRNDTAFALELESI